MIATHCIKIQNRLRSLKYVFCDIFLERTLYSKLKHYLPLIKYSLEISINCPTAKSTDIIQASVDSYLQV